MAIVTYPITGVSEGSNTLSDKLPTRENKTCASTLAGRLVCYQDANGVMQSLTTLNSVTQRPTHVYVGDSVLTVGSTSTGLFSILGADGIIEIDVDTGATIAIGEEVVTTATGKIISRPANTGEATTQDRWCVGIALDATSATKRRIRVNTKVVTEEVTIPAQ